MVTLQHPAPGAARTTRFGEPDAIFRKPHTGTDYAYAGGSCNRPVLAAAAGVARLQTQLGGGGYGIEIDHGAGLVTGYWHLGSRLVRNGAQVAAGQEIARQGSSGAATGCHLHFEVKANGKNLDPESYIGQVAPAASPSDMGHITTYPAAGCPAGYLPARIAGPLVDLPVFGATPLGSNIIEAIGRPGDRGNWNACLLASRGYRVGDDPYAPGTFLGAIGNEIGEGFGAALADSLPFLANAAVVGVALLVGWTGVKQVIGVR